MLSRALVVLLGALVASGCGGASQTAEGPPLVIPSATASSVPTAVAEGRDPPTVAAPDADAHRTDGDDRDPSESNAAPGPTGFKECDDYIRKFSACLAKQGASQRAAMEPGFQALRDMIQQSAALATTLEARRALVKSCRQSMKALAQNPMCK